MAVTLRTIWMKLVPNRKKEAKNKADGKDGSKVEVKHSIPYIPGNIQQMIKEVKSS